MIAETSRGIQKKNKIVYQGNDRDRNNVKLKDKEILSLKLLKVSKSQWTF